MINATVSRHDLDGDRWTLEVAVKVPDDAVVFGDPDPDTGASTTVPHPGRGETFDAEGRPYLLRSFTWPASLWVDDDGNARDTAEDRASRRADALAQMQAEADPPPALPALVSPDSGEALG